MSGPRMFCFGLCAALTLLGCSDDSSDGGGGASGGTGASGGAQASGGSAGDDGSGGTGATGGSSAGIGGTTGGSAGTSGGAGGAPGGTGGGAGGEPQCTSARDTLLGPIDAVSTGEVSVLSTDDGISTVYLDASAGGYQNQATNPALYLDLATLARVDVSDVAAFSSSAWDLGWKRDLIRSNSGDSGPGAAAVAELSKAFDDVTSADVAAADFGQDDFLDNLCIPNTDATGKPITPFSGWYEYDMQNMTLAPAAVTYIIRAANSTDLYKLEILDYYSTPDGQSGPTSARYRVRVGGL